MPLNILADVQPLCHLAACRDMAVPEPSKRSMARLLLTCCISAAALCCFIVTCAQAQTAPQDVMSVELLAVPVPSIPKAMHHGLFKKAVTSRHDGNGALVKDINKEGACFNPDAETGTSSTAAPAAAPAATQSKGCNAAGLMHKAQKLIAGVAASARTSPVTWCMMPLVALSAAAFKASRGAKAADRRRVSSVGSKAQHLQHGQLDKTAKEEKEEEEEQDEEKEAPSSVVMGWSVSDYHFALCIFFVLAIIWCRRGHS